MAVQTLAGIARNGASEQARVAAAQALLDRGWGRAPQAHVVEGGGDFRVVIRQISDVTMPHCELCGAAGVNEFAAKRLAAK
jgi:hypothetical protein